MLIQRKPSALIVWTLGSRCCGSGGEMSSPRVPRRSLGFGRLGIGGRLIAHLVEHETRVPRRSERAAQIAAPSAPYLPVSGLKPLIGTPGILARHIATTSRGA